MGSVPFPTLAFPINRGDCVTVFFKLTLLYSFRVGAKDEYCYADFVEVLTTKKKNATRLDRGRSIKRHFEEPVVENGSTSPIYETTSTLCVLDSTETYSKPLSVVKRDMSTQTDSSSDDNQNINGAVRVPGITWNKSDGYVGETETYCKYCKVELPLGNWGNRVTHLNSQKHIKVSTDKAGWQPWLTLFRKKKHFSNFVMF